MYDFLEPSRTNKLREYSRNLWLAGYDLEDIQRSKGWFKLNPMEQRVVSHEFKALDFAILFPVPVYINKL